MSDASQWNPARVQAAGFCVGCGGCAKTMRETPQGFYEPVAFARASCPFTGEKTENEIADHFFAVAGLARDPHVGHWRNIFAGHVTEGSYRAQGSSGGLGKWLLVELLRAKLVDAVIQVYATGDPSALYRYEIADTEERVREGSRSAYYPVHLADVLREVENGPERRYVLVGVPCFIKAARELTLHSEVFRRRIALTVGILCGQMKSKRYAEALAWQMGVAPGSAKHVDFRGKYSSTSPMNFRTRVQSRDGSQFTRASKTLAGADRWDLGAFKPLACEICDDVFAETADVVIGDAWFGKYKQDAGGANIFITRHEAIDDLIQRGQREGRLHLEKCSVENAIESQISNLRHRQLSLSTRLHQLPPAPPRRWSRHRRSSRYDRWRQRVRLFFSRKSHPWYQRARQAGDIGLFVRRFRIARAVILSANYPFVGTAAGLVALLFWRARPLARAFPALFEAFANSRPPRILIQPPSIHPGNLGDHVMLRAFVEEARRRGMECALWLPRPFTRASDFGLENVRTVRVPFAIAWRFDRFCFVAADTLDGTYDRGWRLWLPRWLSWQMPCFVMNASLRASVRASTARVLRRLSRRGVRFLLRDSRSAERALQKLNVVAAPCADLAFAFSPRAVSLPTEVQSFIDAGRAAGKRIVGLAPALASYTAGSLTKLEELAHDLRDANAIYVIARHDRRSQDDQQAVQRMQEILGQQAIPWQNPTADEIRALTAQVDYAWAMRMHFGIAALCAAKPVVIFEYNDKAKGIWSSVGLEPLVTNDLARVSNLLKEVDLRLTYYAERIRSHLPELRRQAAEQLNYVADVHLA